MLINPSLAPSDEFANDHPGTDVSGSKPTAPLATELLAYVLAIDLRETGSPGNVLPDLQGNEQTPELWPVPGRPTRINELINLSFMHLTQHWYVCFFEYLYDVNLTGVNVRVRNTLWFPIARKQGIGCLRSLANSIASTSR